MKTLRFFKWLVVPLVLYLTYAVVGLPYLRWSYTFLDEGQGHDPLAPRYYLTCTFWGPAGRFRIDHPQEGHCPLILFRKAAAYGHR